MFNPKNIFSRKMTTDNSQPTKNQSKDAEPTIENVVADFNELKTEFNEEDAIKAAGAEHILKLENEIKQENDKLLRLLAEFENYKKRTIKERAEWIKTAGQEIINSLLPVIDDFDRALKNLDDVDDAVKEGIILIHVKLKTILEQKGLTAMETIGQKFDTDLHEAITNIAADENMKGKIVDEAEKGYYLNGKVIRHARVIVGN